MTGTRPSGRRSHIARLAATPSARAAASGDENVAMRSGAVGPVRAVRAQEHPYHRLAVSAGCGERDVHVARDVLGTRDRRPYEEHADGVEAGILEHGAESGRERRARGGPEQVDGVVEARLCWDDGGEPLARRARRLGQMQALGFAGVGAKDSEAARIGQHGDARTGWERLGREQSRRVEQLRERAHPQYAGLVEEGVDRSLGAREGGRVRGRGPRPRRTDTTLEREDGLAARDAARDPPESLGIAEALEVEGHDVRVPIVLPILQ